MTRISGTGRQSAKFDKYENKSEVMEYKAAADVTLPRKREAEDDGEEEKPKLKKIKVCKLISLIKISMKRRIVKAQKEKRMKRAVSSVEAFPRQDRLTLWLRCCI